MWDNVSVLKAIQILIKASKYFFTPLLCTCDGDVLIGFYTVKQTPDARSLQNETLLENSAGRLPSQTQCVGHLYSFPYS